MKLPYVEMNYNYVFFNSPDPVPWKNDMDSYYRICVEDLNDNPNIHVVSFPLDYAPSIIRKLYCIHNSKRANRHFSLPLKRVWYPYYFRNDFIEKRPICFVVSGYYLSVNYMRYLKKKYPEAKFVKIHRDLLHLWKQRNPEWTDDCVKEIFDYNYIFDRNEAKRLGWEYFNEFESKTKIELSRDYPISDVFFAGVAKDRMKKILSAYKHLTSFGLKCDFYIVGAKKDEIVNLPGITYSNTFLSYRQMLFHTVNSKCILEINQEGAIGFTSRFLEAVLYNKLLITDNPEVKNTEMYDSRYIQCVNTMFDIDPSFVEKYREVKFEYNGMFSPLRLFEKIDKKLTSLE